jgi:predicted ATPase
MIDYIKINNFKCFEDITIPLSRLTIMAGANANGKSTSIQALLFLRKTIEENCSQIEGVYQITNETIEAIISLNTGYLLNLGNSGYITNRALGEQDFSLGVFNEIQEITGEYNANISASDLFINVKGIFGEQPESMSILQKSFYYLNAERIGPRISQSMQSSGFPHAGFQGENTAFLIASNDYAFDVEDIRKHPKSRSPRMAQQINAWLDDIMPGVSVSAIENRDTLTAQIKVENHYTKGDPTLATNIGFGISYVLPIIATGLIATEGSYFIVENPEAHLHPSAQSKIGRFLAMVASAGVNVIVETHSDHLINGIQIAVAKKEINSDSVIINFFSQNEDINQPEIESISLDDKGELSKWPVGFFDQTQIDFAELFKTRTA